MLGLKSMARLPSSLTAAAVRGWEGCCCTTPPLSVQSERTHQCLSAIHTRIDYAPDNLYISTSRHWSARKQDRVWSTWCKSHDG